MSNHRKIRLIPKQRTMDGKISLPYSPIAYPPSPSPHILKPQEIITLSISPSSLPSSSHCIPTFLLLGRSLITTFPPRIPPRVNSRRAWAFYLDHSFKTRSTYICLRVALTKRTSLRPSPNDASQRDSGQSAAYLTSIANMRLPPAQNSTLSATSKTYLQSFLLSTYKLQQLLHLPMSSFGARPVTKGNRPMNQNCCLTLWKSREWSRRRPLVIVPSFMQIISVREILLQSQRSSPAYVVRSAILRLSLLWRSSFPHRPAGLEFSISLKIQLLTSSRYSSGSIFQISYTFFFRASWYSREQSILKYSFRSNFYCLSFFLIYSLCCQNCQKIQSNQSSLRDSISGRECILERQNPKRNPSKQRQMILQMISSGAPAETLPQAAEEAVPSDQYMVYSSCMPNPSLIMSGHAETLTQSSYGWEQLLLFNARSRAKKAQPTQLTMIIKMNSPQKMLQRRQKGVPIMQDRKRLWNKTILQILNRQINQMILAKELYPWQLSQKMAIARQTRSYISSVFRMESHFNFTTYLLKRTFFDISGFMTNFLTR